MRIKLIFHGFLKHICPNGFEVEASSIADALKGWSIQHKSQLKNRPVLTVDEAPDDARLFSLPTTSEINVRPFFEGAGGGGGGGFIKIVIGAVLIATGLDVAAGALAGSTAAVLGTAMTGVGIAMVAGGLLELLSPSPKLNLDFNMTSDSERSRYLGAPKNTTKIGTPITIGWGTFKVYGHYLSYNIDAARVLA